MIQLNPNFLIKAGRKEFAVLPFEEYTALEEFLADVEDLLILREAKKDEGHSPTLSLDSVMEKYGLRITPDNMKIKKTLMRASDWPIHNYCNRF